LVKEGRKGLDEVEVEMQQSNEVQEEGRKSLIKGDNSSLSTTSLFFEGKMQEDTRARMRTRLTPIAEYQMEETSYKSDKKVLIIPKFLRKELLPQIYCC